MIGSVSGSRPSPGTAAYGAAKAGLENLARSMAVEWAPEVRVNTLVVGMVRTERSHLHYGDEDGIAAVARTVPLGRLAEPVRRGGGGRVPRLRRGRLHQRGEPARARGRGAARVPGRRQRDNHAGEGSAET